MTLRWNPSPTTDASGYRAHFGTESGNYSNIIDVGNETSVTLSGLEDGVTYYFVVSAYDEDGLESDYSNEATYTPAVRLVPPPSRLQLQTDAQGQMMLSLTGPAGRTYDLQASENLQDWTVIRVVTVGSGGALGFTDPEASNFPQRFYRAKETQPTVRLGVSPAGQAELRIAGQNNHTYDIQASSNLSDWTVIGTVTVDASGAVGFTDPEAADQPARFYRTQDMTN